MIADAKRGDIDVTAAAYAQAFLGATPTAYGPVDGLGADALTVNPLLGADSLRRSSTPLATRGGGLFVLVRTSNPGAADVQELDAGRAAEPSATGSPRWSPSSARPASARRG